MVYHAHSYWFCHLDLLKQKKNKNQTATNHTKPPIVKLTEIIAKNLVNKNIYSILVTIVSKWVKISISF